MNWDANTEHIDGYQIYMSVGCDDVSNMKLIETVNKVGTKYQPVECSLKITRPKMLCFRLKAFVHCDTAAFACKTGILTSDFSDSACIDLQSSDFSDPGLPCDPSVGVFNTR